MCSFHNYSAEVSSRPFVGQAYENELATELAKLEKRFEDWRAGKICAGELAEIIHQYHNGPARDLWSKYNQNPYTELLIASAMVRGILQREDVSEEVWPYVEAAIERYRFITD